jgi:hypothetical protein
VRNTQMTAVSLCIALLGCVSSARKIAERGFFAGYNARVWGVILLQVRGCGIVFLFPTAD